MTSNSYRSTATVGYDESLRQFMLSVYNNMTIGLAITAVVSFFVGTNPALLQMFFSGPQKWIVMLAPLAFVLFISVKIYTMSPATARAWFFAYAVSMGLSLSVIFAIYKLGSIATIFFASASMFGLTSLYGYTTKQDLTKMGGFLILGLIGVIVASLINIFVQSSLATTAISIITVLIFVGLTAYDTQQLIAIHDSMDGNDRERAGIMGALSLYLDFINIFVNLLQLFGDRD